MPKFVSDGQLPIFDRLKALGVSPLGAVLLVVLALFPLVVQDEYLLRLLISSMIFGSLAMAFDFTAGFINIVNFGYAAFWGLGAYTSGLLAVKLGLTPWLGIFAGALIAGIVGLGLGILTLRLAGIFASCMAWFVALALMAVASNWVTLTRGNSGLSVPLFFDSPENLPYYYVVFALTIITYAVLTLVTRSRVGLAFKAIGQNLPAAQASGINPTKYRIINFTLSCTLAGLIGGFYAHFVGILGPNVMHTSHTIEVMAIAYVGGRGSIWGGLVSALILIPLMEYLKPFMELRLIMYGALLVFVMLFYPQGLSGIYYGVKEFFRRKIAARGMDAPHHN